MTNQDQNDTAPDHQSDDLDPILDIPVTLQVNLGRADMPIADLLHLNIGSVIELDNEVGAPIEIFVNNRLIAKGEVILVDDKLAISILEADTRLAN